MTSKNENTTDTEQTNTKKKARGIVEGLSEGFGSASRRFAKWIPMLLIFYVIVASISNRVPLPSLTDTQTVFFVVLIVMLAVLFFPVRSFINKIYDPKKEVVIQVNVTKSAIINWWYAGPELVGDMDVKHGRKVSFVVGNRVFHLVTDFDPMKNEADGVDIREDADWDMIYDPDVIEYHRWKNNAKWQAASRILSILPDLGVDAENKYFQILAQERADMELVDSSYMDTYTDEMPSPDEIGEQIEETVKQYVDDNNSESVTADGGEDE